MRSNEHMSFLKYAMGEDEMMEKLTCVDSVGQMDYSVFRDVLAFDTSYQKNKYMYHLVFFFFWCQSSQSKYSFWFCYCC